MVYLKGVVFKFISVVLSVYIAFNLLWGLNYNRFGIDYRLKLESSGYTNQDLLQITKELASRVNALQPLSERSRPMLNKKKHLFGESVKAYKNLSTKIPILKYSYPSVKPSIFSYLGNFLGFTGYYNPFTGEAQVNTTIPLFILPFTTCHEIGHQLGYAKESEANFASYLSATSSDDSAFLYSVYFEMFAYAGRYLYYTDSLSLKQINRELLPGVKKDIQELRNFYSNYDSPLETAIDRIYSQYLKANEQPTGKMSYNEVVGMLIAYYKKNGKI